MTTLHEKMHALEKAFKEERQRKLPIAPHPAELGFAYVLAARTEKWSQLSQIAAKNLKAAHAGIAKLAPSQARVAKLGKDIEAILRAMGLDVPSLNKRDDWDQIAARMRVTLEKKMSPQQASKLVTALGKKSLETSKDQIFAPLNQRAEAIQQSLRSWHATIMAASFAHALDRFNREKALAVVPLQPARKLLNQSAARLASERKKLHASLKSTSLPRIKKSAASLLKFANGESLQALLQLGARITAVRSNGTGTESLAQLGLVCGNLIREFLLAQACGLRIQGLATTGRGDINQWIQAASELEFDSPAPLGSVTDLSNLSTAPSRFEGKAISVRGVVIKVENKHRAAKVLSTVTLKSMADDATVLVGISHIKLDSGGVVPGSYAQVTGVFSKDDDIFHKPMVRVTRRQLKAESKKSWSAWVQFNLKDIFVPVAHGLLATATWEKGFDGAANPLRYGTWRDQEEGV